MAHALPLACPACTQPMTVTELTCPNCQTRVQGVFQPPGLLRLNPEQMQFVEVFLRCRGNIKEVERDLKISYPTVRARLDQVIQAMGFTLPARPDDDAEEGATHVLDALGTGDLTFEEALKLLKEES